MRRQLCCVAIGILASLSLAACGPYYVGRGDYYGYRGYAYPYNGYAAYTISAPPPLLDTVPQSLSQMSYDLVFNLALNDSYEIEAGRLAVRRSGTAQVRRFAERVIAGNRMANQDLMSTMRRNGTPMTTAAAIDSRYQAMIRDLAAARGREFDRRYVVQQAVAHRDAIAILQDYVHNGDNPALRQFAERTLQAAQAGMQLLQTLPGGRAAGT